MENKKPFSESSDEEMVTPEAEFTPSEEDTVNANHRDLGSDDFDETTDVNSDDRVRGAGRQSLEQLAIDDEESSWGLEEHIGGLRADLPEPNVNDELPARNPRKSA